MNAVSAVLLHDTRSNLVKLLDDLKGQSVVEDAFAYWLIGTDTAKEQLRKLVHVSATQVGAQRTYRDVAILCFGVALRVLNEQEMAVLADGLGWLVKRSHTIAGAPADFMGDAISIAGMAVATQGLENSDLQQSCIQWLDRVIATAVQSPGLSAFDKCLLIEVGTILGVCVADDASVRTKQPEVCLALASKGYYKAARRMSLEEDELFLLRKVRVLNEVPARVAHVAMQLVALDWVTSTAPVCVPGRIEVEDLVKLLQRVPAGLANWTWEAKSRTGKQGGEPRKWHVDHEYHVQNLLYAVLCPLFPDLEDEEYTIPVGHKHPRVDLGIPSMRAIIEVKFVRPTDQFPKIIEQIAADSGLYLQDQTRYDKIIAFIWDNSRRNEEHDLLKRGLEQINGVIAAIIMSRPGKMTEIA